MVGLVQIVVRTSQSSCILQVGENRL
jgi:hypothetical protein